MVNAWAPALLTGIYNIFIYNIYIYIYIYIYLYIYEMEYDPVSHEEFAKHVVDSL